MICMVLWYNYYSYYCALLFCCSQVFVICFVFFLLSNTFAHLNRLMTSFEQCFSYASFFLLLSGLKNSFEHRLFNTSFFLLLFGLKMRFEQKKSPVLHQFPSITFWTEDYFGTSPFVHQFPSAAFLNRFKKKISQIRKFVDCI
jgi:hypothetical protein